MIYNIPGPGKLELDRMVLDLNGTLSIGGNLLDGVDKRIKDIKELGFHVVLFTGNTRGDADELVARLGIDDWRQTKSAADKRRLALEMDVHKTGVAIGNGLIDCDLLKVARLGIAVVQAEGAHTQTMLAADINMPTIHNALDLFIDPDRLIATLRP